MINPITPAYSALTRAAENWRQICLAAGLKPDEATVSQVIAALQKP